MVIRRRELVTDCLQTIQDHRARAMASAIAAETAPQMTLVHNIRMQRRSVVAARSPLR
jgi:hypothetical protein